MSTDASGAEPGLRQRLWNDGLRPRKTAMTGDQYQALVFEQYRLYVEMTDRISARRNASNTYFLTLNTALAAIMVAIAGERLADAPVWVLTIGLLLFLAQCAAWFAIVLAYRQLNSARWAVIGEMEKRLPSNPYSDGEWIALGEGEDWRKYLPLSLIEQWVPIIFAAAYLLGYLALSF